MPNTTVPAAGEAIPASAHDLISNLEGAIAVARGLADAISQLSELDEHSQRRLGAIHSVSWPLLDELKAARETVMALYDRDFEDQKIAKTGI
jgi:hypothetical protein